MIVPESGSSLKDICERAIDELEYHIEIQKMNAKLKWEYYTELINQGFTEEQSMFLIQ